MGGWDTVSCRHNPCQRPTSTRPSKLSCASSLQPTQTIILATFAPLALLALSAEQARLHVFVRRLAAEPDAKQCSSEIRACDRAAAAELIADLDTFARPVGE